MQSLCLSVLFPLATRVARLPRVCVCGGCAQPGVSMLLCVVVSGTIAPARELPELTAEETIRIILSNLNLVVPVVAALLVIIIAIVVICVLRSKGNHHKGTTPLMPIVFLPSFFSLFSSLDLCSAFFFGYCSCGLLVGSLPSPPQLLFSLLYRIG